MFKHSFMHESARILEQYKGTYILLIDVCNFIEFNEDYGFRVGDEALIEVIRRIGAHTSDEMELLTLAGDEWVLIPKKNNYDEVATIANSILQYNGECVLYEGIKAPLTIRIAILKADSIERKNAVFAQRGFNYYMDKLKGCDVYLLDLT